MKKFLMLFILTSIVMLSGCNNNHAFDFNSTSNSNCYLECEEFMKEYKCNEAIPIYQSEYTNNEQTKGICSCYIRNCVK